MATNQTFEFDKLKFKKFAIQHIATHILPPGRKSKNTGNPAAPAGSQYTDIFWKNLFFDTESCVEYLPLYGQKACDSPPLRKLS